MSKGQYNEQGEGANKLPHLLTARIDTWRSGAVKWSVICPYEGNRECGFIEECNGTDYEVAKWGCEPHPKAPSDDLARYYLDGKLVGPPGAWEEAWDRYFEARDRWADEVHGGYGGHRTDKCWFEYVLKEGDVEPEYYLEPLEGQAVSSPLKVCVGYTGSGEETEPVFKLWEEHSNAS